MDICLAFDNYKKIIIQVDNDLTFWKSFLTHSISNYQEQIVKPEEIYSSLFSAYNIDIITQNKTLNIHKESASILTVNLEKHQVEFFRWIINLSILKCYNALEILLLQVIWLKFYPALNNPTTNKKDADKLQAEIKKYLAANNLNTETKNNRHLISFLKSNSSNINSFYSQEDKKQLKTTWENYFELFSILRNIIAHQGTIISPNTLNEIKSKFKFLFEQHYTIEKDTNNINHLLPKENCTNSFIQLSNDFAVNSIKFLYGENDLKFIKLFSAA